MRRWAQVSLALSVLLVQTGASAVCNRPDLVFAVPPDGALEVPPNAKLFARYRSNAEYDGEEVKVVEAGVGEQALTGDWNAGETLLSISPTLTPGGNFSVEWPRLRGVNSANLGRGKEVTFTVGTLLDEEPPSFEGLAGVSWDTDREKDDCTDSLEERYLFDFDLGAASDDGGRESLMLTIFQTKGPHVKASAPQPISVLRMPGEGKTVRVARTLNDGEGDVCFAAIARDLTGQVSASGAKEVCTTTVAPPYFEGCSFSGRPARPAWLGLMVIAGLSWGRRRSRR